MRKEKGGKKRKEEKEWKRRGETMRASVHRNDAGTENATQRAICPEERWGGEGKEEEEGEERAEEQQRWTRKETTRREAYEVVWK